MNGTITKCRVEVTCTDAGEPIILVSVNQLRPVRAILTQLRIKHRVDEEAVGITGLAIVTLPRSAPVSLIQRALDEEE